MSRSKGTRLASCSFYADSFALPSASTQIQSHPDSTDFSVIKACFHDVIHSNEIDIKVSRSSWRGNITKEVLFCPVFSLTTRSFVWENCELQASSSSSRGRAGTTVGLVRPSPLNSAFILAQHYSFLNHYHLDRLLWLRSVTQSHRVGAVPPPYPCPYPQAISFSLSLPSYYWQHPCIMRRPGILYSASSCFQSHTFIVYCVWLSERLVDGHWLVLMYISIHHPQPFQKCLVDDDLLINLIAEYGHNSCVLQVAS